MQKEINKPSDASRMRCNTVVKKKFLKITSLTPLFKSLLFFVQTTISLSLNLKTMQYKKAKEAEFGIFLPTVHLTCSILSNNASLWRSAIYLITCLVYRDLSYKESCVGAVCNRRCCLLERHQRLDEIWIFFLPALHWRNQHSCLKKKTHKTYWIWLILLHSLTNLSCNTLAKLNAILLRRIRLLKCVRFIQHKLVKNARVSDIVFLHTTLLISCIVRVKIIKSLSSRWWRFELATSAIHQ